MQEDRFSDASGSQQSALEEATPINPLTARRQKGQVKHQQYQVQNLSTTSSSHLQSKTKLKPFTSQSHQRLPGIQYNTNKLPQNKTSKLLENQLKVRQLALEVEEQGAPPDITMMMTQRGVNDIFDRKKVSTTVSRMLKSRIRSIREAKSQTQETKSKVQESVFHPKVRDFLKGQKELTHIVADLQKANQVFEQLSTRVSLYRVELGECMDKVLCTYSKIWEEFILCVIKIMQGKDKQLENQNREHQKAIESILNQTKDTVENNIRLQNALTAANYRNEGYKQIEARLEMEIKHLRGILRQDTEGYAKLANDAKLNKQGESWVKSVNPIDTNSEMISSAAENKALQDNLTQMESLILKMEKKSIQKNEILEQMRKLLL